MGYVSSLEFFLLLRCLLVCREVALVCAFGWVTNRPTPHRQKNRADKKVIVRGCWTTASGGKRKVRRLFSSSFAVEILTLQQALLAMFKCPPDEIYHYHSKAFENICASQMLNHYCPSFRVTKWRVNKTIQLHTWQYSINDMLCGRFILWVVHLPVIVTTRIITFLVVMPN